LRGHRGTTQTRDWLSPRRCLSLPAIGAIAPAFAFAYLPPDQAPPTPQAFNLDEAKALADKAGISGQQPTLMVYEDDLRTAQVVRNQLSEIGLDVQIEQLQQAAWNERWLASDFDWIFNGSAADADPDDGHWNFFTLEGPWNVYSYKSQKVNDLLVETRATSDQTERAKLFQEVQALLQQDVPHAFIHHVIDIAGFASDVQGLAPIPEIRYLETVWLDR
jgi:ABC-type transport system substrate-binding protein